MQVLRRLVLVMGLGLGGVPLALASATDADYVRCHTRAAEIALECLNQRPGNLDEACWHQAKTANEACYRTLRDDHDRERIEARRKAERERAKRRAIDGW